MEEPFLCRTHFFGVLLLLDWQWFFWLQYWLCNAVCVTVVVAADVWGHQWDVKSYAVCSPVSLYCWSCESRLHVVKYISVTHISSTILLDNIHSIVTLVLCSACSAVILWSEFTMDAGVLSHESSLFSFINATVPIPDAAMGVQQLLQQFFFPFQLYRLINIRHSYRH